VYICRHTDEQRFDFVCEEIWTGGGGKEGGIWFGGVDGGVSTSRRVLIFCIGEVDG
jgi:hypothetical protein